MSDHRQTSGAGSGFQRVLDAEKAADARVEAGHRAAREAGQAARAEARRIAARADRRLQALHAGMQEFIAEEKARMAQAFEVERVDLAAPPNDARITAAARRLARRLAGIDSS